MKKLLFAAALCALSFGAAHVSVAQTAPMADKVKAKDKKADAKVKANDKKAKMKDEEGKTKANAKKGTIKDKAADMR